MSSVKEKLPETVVCWLWLDQRERVLKEELAKCQKDKNDMTPQLIEYLKTRESGEAVLFWKDEGEVQQFGPEGSLVLKEKKQEVVVATPKFQLTKQVILSQLEQWLKILLKQIQEHPGELAREDFTAKASVKCYIDQFKAHLNGPGLIRKEELKEAKLSGDKKEKDAIYIVKRFVTGELDESGKKRRRKKNSECNLENLSLDDLKPSKQKRGKTCAVPELPPGKRAIQPFLHLLRLSSSRA